MINSSTIEKLREMSFKTFAKELEFQLRDSSTYAQLGFEERLGLLVDAEWNQKQANKLNRCTSNAHLKIPSASIEGIEYLPDRKLDKGEIIRLSTCNFINENSHILITGATGSGKTYLACALGKSACRKFKKVKYITMLDLLDDFHLARTYSTASKAAEEYCKADLLIIDDWLIKKLNLQQSFDLFYVIQKRCDNKSGKTSTIICSQFSADKWYDRMNPDPDETTSTEAVIDRLIHDSYEIFIQGNISMRERHGINYRKKQNDNV